MTLLHRAIQSPCCGDRNQLIMASVSYRCTKMTTKINYVRYNLLDWAEGKAWSCKIFRPPGFNYGTRNIKHSTTTESTDSTVLHMTQIRTVFLSGNTVCWYPGGTVFESWSKIDYPGRCCWLLILGHGTINTQGKKSVKNNMYLTCLPKIKEYQEYKNTPQFNILNWSDRPKFN